MEFARDQERFALHDSGHEAPRNRTATDIPELDLEDLVREPLLFMLVCKSCKRTLIKESRDDTAHGSREDCPLEQIVAIPIHTSVSRFNFKAKICGMGVWAWNPWNQFNVQDGESGQEEKEENQVANVCQFYGHREGEERCIITGTHVTHRDPRGTRDELSQRVTIAHIIPVHSWRLINDPNACQPTMSHMLVYNKLPMEKRFEYFYDRLRWALVPLRVYKEKPENVDYIEYVVVAFPEDTITSCQAPIRFANPAIDYHGTIVTFRRTNAPHHRAVCTHARAALCQNRELRRAIEDSRYVMLLDCDVSDKLSDKAVSSSSSMKQFSPQQEKLMIRLMGKHVGMGKAAAKAFAGLGEKTTMCEIMESQGEEWIYNFILKRILESNLSKEEAGVAASVQVRKMFDREGNFWQWVHKN